MFSGGFGGDNLSAQSIRFQKQEIPTVKMLIISQLFRYMEQRYTCFRDRQLEPHSVQALMALLEDLHTIVTLRDYRLASEEISHKEKFLTLKKEYISEIEKYMSQKFNDDTARIKASLKAMEILNKIFYLETRYLERFGLLESEGTSYEAEDIDTPMGTEEYSELLKKHGKSIDELKQKEIEDEFNT